MVNSFPFRPERDISRNHPQRFPVGLAGGNRIRPLCQYPLVAKYKGTGSTDDAANFVCSPGF